jgi:hypothetical protein
MSYALVTIDPSMSYAFSYYGADTIDPSAEGTIDPFAEWAIVFDAAVRQRIVMLHRNSDVASTDQIGVIVKSIGSRLRLVYKVDSSIPEPLGDLVRRAA